MSGRGCLQTVEAEGFLPVERFTFGPVFLLRVKQNTEPCPGSLSTQICPPCSSMILRVM